MLRRTRGEDRCIDQITVLQTNVSQKTADKPSEVTLEARTDPPLTVCEGTQPAGTLILDFQSLDHEK
jgi:hypothetical protein